MKKITMPQINLKKTGAHIRALRELNNIPVKEIMNIMNFETPRAIYNWEEGKNAPSIDNLLVLSELFRVTLDDLVIKDFKEIDIK